MRTSAQCVERSVHADEVDEQAMPFEVRDLRFKVRTSALARRVVAGRRTPMCAPAERRVASVVERFRKRLTALDAAPDRERRIYSWMFALISDDAHAQLPFQARQLGGGHRITELDWHTRAPDERQRQERQQDGGLPRRGGETTASLSCVRVARPDRRGP
jgi:hypothetical protein